MKAYGFQKGDAFDRGEDSAADEHPFELREVSLVADAASLRRIAGFLNHCADLIGQHGDKFNHEHLCDTVPNWKREDTDIIVVRHGEGQ